MDNPPPKIAFLASPSTEAQAAARAMKAQYGGVAEAQADVIVALGGDGLMLRCLHRILGRGKDTPVFGMNLGSVGFLLNKYRKGGLPARLAKARRSVLNPLVVRGVDAKGRKFQAHAINEVSLFRQTAEAAKLRLFVDGKRRVQEMICDGVLLATPAGSTAYNLSAHGPILPLDSNLLALTPISVFRPRSWRGALLPSNASVRIKVLDAARRPVSAVADHTEFKQASEIRIEQDSSRTLHLLFDPNHGLEERIIAEQFLL